MKTAKELKESVEQHKKSVLEGQDKRVGEFLKQGVAHPIYPTIENLLFGTLSSEPPGNSCLLTSLDLQNIVDNSLNEYGCELVFRHIIDVVHNRGYVTEWNRVNVGDSNKKTLRLLITIPKEKE